jgi:hypothetical protein
MGPAPSKPPPPPPNCGTVGTFNSSCVCDTSKDNKIASNSGGASGLFYKCVVKPPPPPPPPVACPTIPTVINLNDKNNNCYCASSNLTKARVGNNMTGVCYKSTANRLANGNCPVGYKQYTLADNKQVCYN